MKKLLGPHAGLAWMARTEREKRNLLVTLRAEHAEGAIFKRADAPYTIGRPARGGTMRRWKFRKRMDVIVMRQPGEGGKRSFAMFVMDAQGQPVAIGKVSAHTFFFKVTPKMPTVAEVEYLTASDAHHLIQPTVIRLRDDKPPEACLLSQLVVGKRYRANGTDDA
jgi:ATP-dependent DNA ligase